MENWKMYLKNEEKRNKKIPENVKKFVDSTYKIDQPNYVKFAELWIVNLFYCNRIRIIFVYKIYFTANY